MRQSNNLHKIPSRKQSISAEIFTTFFERGWLEIRTACQIATTLENLGYEVLVGKEVDKDARMGLP